MESALRLEESMERIWKGGGKKTQIPFVSVTRVDSLNGSCKLGG